MTWCEDGSLTFCLLRAHLIPRSDDWDYTQKFDYIHTRVTGGCWWSFEEQVIQQAFEALEPGGYLESQEYDFLVGCDDGTLDPEGPLAQWFRHITVAGERCNRSTTTGHSMKEAYERVGFVDVREVTFKIPMNGWPKDDHLKKIGRMWEINILSGLSGFSLSLFHRVFDKSAAETEVSKQAPVARGFELALRLWRSWRRFMQVC